MPFYGADVWDPVLIVSEMVMMQVRASGAAGSAVAVARMTLARRHRAAQAVFYVLGGITLTANALIGGESVSLRLFFDAEAVTFSTAPGVGVAAAWFLAGLARRAAAPRRDIATVNNAHFPAPAARWASCSSWSGRRSAGTLASPSTSSTSPFAPCTRWVGSTAHDPSSSWPAQAAHPLCDTRCRASPLPGPGGSSPLSPAPP